MAYELIITEKPKSALKIAQALDDKIGKDAINGVPFYKLKYKGKEIVITSAVGHLYSLAEKTSSKWAYPVFDIEWKEGSEVKKESSHVAKYINAIKKLSIQFEQLKKCGVNNILLLVQIFNGSKFIR